MKNQYSGYLDLLAIKNKSMIGNNEYFQNIQTFVNSLQKYSKKYTVEVYVFSDSAYFRCCNDKVFDFLQELRLDLIKNSIYFTCSLCNGYLEITEYSRDKSSNVSGYAFLSSYTVSLYEEQAKLKGIGINIEFAENMHKSNRFIKSYYIEDINSFIIKQFYDLKYELDNDEIVISIINNILNTVIYLNFINKSATRYYFSVFVSIINSLFEKQFDYEQDLYKNIINMFSNINKTNCNDVILHMYSFLIETSLSNFDYNSATALALINMFAQYEIFNILVNNLTKISNVILSHRSRMKISETFTYLSRSKH